MHRSEIKESVLAGMRRVASGKLLNQHWHGGGVLEGEWKNMKDVSSEPLYEEFRPLKARCHTIKVTLIWQMLFPRPL